MKEINEKDLEQAAGGIDGYDPKCDEYKPAREVYKRLPTANQTCLTCLHYHSKDGLKYCDLTNT